MLVTSWKTIRPKKEMDHGFSCYYLKEGYKVSRFYRADHSLYCCYCDIISPYYEENTNSLTVTDLLVDVIVAPDGFVKVADVDELVTALNAQLLSLEQLKAALDSLARLLSLIYAGRSVPFSLIKNRGGCPVPVTFPAVLFCLSICKSSARPLPFRPAACVRTKTMSFSRALLRYCKFRPAACERAKPEPEKTDG